MVPIDIRRRAASPSSACGSQVDDPLSPRLQRGYSHQDEDHQILEVSLVIDGRSLVQLDVTQITTLDPQQLIMVLCNQQLNTWKMRMQIICHS